MLNLRVVALSLVVVFIGLFTFRALKDEPSRKIASSDIGREQARDIRPEKKKAIVQVVKEGELIPDYKGNEMLLQDKTLSEKTLDLSKKATGKYEKYPIYQGRIVVEVHGGSVLVPENVPKKFVLSSEGEHSELVPKVFKFFSNLGFNQDNKMKVVRGDSFLALRGDEALKVEAFTVSYNWNGTAKKETWLMRTINGRMYKKLREPLIASN
tara:strand:+ start:749 stop:1381 length:633 start_codon:yes stop_codon:yes gene_type:complete